MECSRKVTIDLDYEANKKDKRNSINLSSINSNNFDFNYLTH